jgi:CDP-diacylglycerol--glycerol-3-phosphate 3-phosphatidyltransferase
MWRQIPNAITVLRLLLAVVFFAILSFYQYEGRGDPWFLNFAFLIALCAITSDWLDGYLARKWKVTSQFGRIVDPFVDKILVLGSFAFFAGKNFIIPDTATPHAGPAASFVVKTITGVTPAMVVILIARELLVTTLRSIAEGGGQNFGAQWSGKLKMVFQSVTILVVLAYVNYFTWLSEHQPAEQIARYTRDFCIWVTVITTVWSGVLYVVKAVRVAGKPHVAADREVAAREPVGSK